MEELLEALKGAGPAVLEAVNAAKTEEELLAVLRENSIEVGSVDDLKRLAGEAIDAEDLEKVAGGALADAAATMGGKTVDECVSVGYRTYCHFLGD